MTAAAESRPLIVTDLDGTLLDHHSYSFAPAQPLLARLEYLGVPVVINTSKTRREVEALRRQLPNRHPFIVENGSATFIPEGYFSAPQEGAEPADGYLVHCEGARIDAIRRVLEPLKAQFDFTAFGDWGVEDLMHHAGLERAAAEGALAREFSEPLLWRDTETARQRFIEALHAAGLGVLQGGRYLHVLGDVDKGRSSRRLMKCYAREQGAPPTFIALGDSANDRQMLEAADIPVIVRSPTHPPPDITSRVAPLVTAACGPEGWAETVAQLLPRFGLNDR